MGAGRSGSSICLLRNIPSYGLFIHSAVHRDLVCLKFEIATVHACRENLAHAVWCPGLHLLLLRVYTLWNKMGYTNIRFWEVMPNGFTKWLKSFVYSWQPLSVFLAKVSRAMFNVLQVSWKFLFHKHHLNEWRLKLTRSLGWNFFPNDRLEEKILNQTQKCQSAPGKIHWGLPCCQNVWKVIPDGQLRKWTAELASRT